MLAASWNRQNTYHEVQMSNQEFVTALEYFSDRLHAGFDEIVNQKEKKED